MRAVVSFRKSKARSKKWKELRSSTYMRFKNVRAINSFKKRMEKRGYDVKIYSRLGW